MNHQTKTMLYVCIVFSVALLLYSCKNSLTDPQGGPADERILFIKFDNTITEICSIKPDGTDPQIIASYNTAGEFLRQGYHEAQWSPDKSLIVITGGPNEALEFYPLWLMDNQGNLLYRLTWNGGSPNWSSDGNEILFSRRRDYFSFLVDY
jgi:Tol biopolymer transport system component